MVHRKRKQPPDDSLQQRDPTPTAGPSTGHALSDGSSLPDQSERKDAQDHGGISTYTTRDIPSSSNTRLSNNMLSPITLERLVLCPLCQDRLIQPTTLRCGHSICARHVTSPQQQVTTSVAPADPPAATTLPLCPLPNCAWRPSSASHLPRIPPSSRVHFRPAPSTPEVPPPVQPKTVPEPRLDVTLNKVIALVARTKHSLSASPTPPEDSDSDDDDASSADANASAYSSARDYSNPRPRKRRRRNTISSQDDDEQEDDLLSHLQKQVVRQRTLRHDEPLLPLSPEAPHDSSSAHSRDAILTRFEKELLTELTCEICFVLFFQPTTTPCQHTFCAKCLQRSLDHSSACPLCRQDLPGFSYFQDHASNKTVLSIILESFPVVYEERAEAIALEERDSRLDTPIFVCQLSFPGMPTLLHFFEPRYRLMLRRCLESPTPQFGMIMAPKPGAGVTQVEYGTMLEIRSVQMLPDGRSMVETWGSFRFRVLERGTLDGYMVGRIERIDDYPEDLSSSSLLFPQPVSPTAHSGNAPSESSDPPPSTSASASASTSTPPSPTASTSLHSATSTDPPANPTAPPLSVPIPPHPPTNEDLMTTCRSFLDRLRRGTAPWVVQRLSSTYGTIPTDPSAFSFWVAIVLPIDEHEKAKLLPLRSARLRLLLLVHWIEQLNNQWYAFVWKMVACLAWTALVLTVSRLVGFI